MDILSPVAAAVAVATNAVVAGLALKKLCRGEVAHAAGILQTQKTILDQWKRSWEAILKQCMQDSDAERNHLIVFSAEASQAVKRTILMIKSHYEDAEGLLKSCGSPTKTRKVMPPLPRRRRRRVTLFIRLLFPIHGIRIEDYRRRAGPPPTLPRRGPKLRHKLRWCTSTKEQVFDLLAMIRDGQQDLGSIMMQGFDFYRLISRNRLQRPLADKLTVSRAFRQFKQKMQTHQMPSVVGHALIRGREGLGNASNDQTSPSEAPIRLVFVAASQEYDQRDKPTVMLAKISNSIDSQNTDADVPDVSIRPLEGHSVDSEDRQPLVEIMSKHHDIDTHEALLKRVQMALTIAINVFDLYESECLPINLSIADVYTYQDALLSQSEYSKVQYRDQMYFLARDSEDSIPKPTPFDHMHERSPYPRDIHLHRLGVMLFEIGHELEYQDVLALPESPIGTLEDQLRDHANIINRSIKEIGGGPKYRSLVRSCLSGSLGQDLGDAAESSFARRVISELETIEVGIANAIRRENQ
ncbi:hypothetical protein D6D03_07948 [Aureobasidium pullulans]|nr:hypothetical protein D6D03_07948 [Aureobasidium pullulans]